MKSLMLVLSVMVMSGSFLYSSKVSARSNSNPFYVEPYAGYFIGKTKGTNIGDRDIKSMYFGARIGIETAKGYIFGVDYGQGIGDHDPDNNAIGDGDYEQKDIGAFIGYRISPQIRVYGSYIFKYESELEQNSGNIDIEGDGYNAGISIKAAANVKIGLEYQIRNLKETSGGFNLASDNKSTAYLLTLKLPVPMPFSFR